MHIRKLCSALLVALFSTLALAEGTQTWRQSKFEDFEKGTAKGVAITSEGTLELAPSFKLIDTTPATFVWALAADAKGNVYAATGAPARVYRITPQGQASIIFQPKELQVQALAVDGDVIYAATSPDGKVYKVEPRAVAAAAAKKGGAKPEATEAAAPQAPVQENRSGEAPVDPNFTSSVLFDPQTKYIWDLALDGKGDLYVATGDRGEIYRVNRAGEHTLFFKSDEPHIRVLAFDPRGNLIAGSDGSGLIYRISPAGEAFVLYSAPKKEITALAVDKAGNIFAAGVGEKRVANPPAGFPVANPNATPAIQPPPGGAPPTAPMGGFGQMASAGGAEIYQIAPDGSPRRIWSSRDDLVYALTFDPKGRLLAGSGNKGRIYVVRSDEEFSDLLKASANQVTAFASAPDGVYAATSNLGKVFEIGGGQGSEGTYESDVFDAHIFSRWGRAEVRGSGNFDFYARSGNVDNPDRNWSAWEKVDLGRNAELTVPPARFAQWKVVLHPGPVPPRVESVTLNYLTKNVPPEVDDVGVMVGYRYPTLPKAPGGDSGGAAGVPPQPQVTPPPMRDRDSIAVRWSAHDDNDDDLVYSIYYRGDGETKWKLLKDKVGDKYYSFDSGLLPDGGYVIRVVASDAPSHSPDEALTSYLDSDRFEVDNTPPVVGDLNATPEVGGMHITFHANDSFSPIKRAEYSVDAGDWQVVDPVGQLSDARTENYDFTAPVGTVTPAAVASETAGGEVKPGKGKKPKNAATESDPAPQEHTIVVRVYDRFDNMGTAKVVVHGK